MNSPTPAPFAIKLHLEKGLALAVELANVSTVEQPFLYQTDFQSAWLVLAAADGAAIEPYDNWSTKDVEIIIHQRFLEKLAPGRAQIVQRSLFEKGKDGLYGIRWGHFQFSKLKPGIYTGHVTWYSAINSCDDPERGEGSIPIKGIWLGEIESAPINITLP